MSKAVLRASLLFAAVLSMVATARAQTVPVPPSSSFPRPAPTQPIKGPVTMTSDRLDDGAIITFEGHVVAQFDGNVVNSDQATYNKSSRTLIATGNIVVREQSGNIIRASRYTLTDVDVVSAKR
jgi:lipopolysaccharide assembly outer membrane protein LptD (OstA)